MTSGPMLLDWDPPSDRRSPPRVPAAPPVPTEDEVDGRFTHGGSQGDEDIFDDVQVVAQERPTGNFFRDWGVNPTIATRENAVSTFAVDVDSASFSMARSMLDRRQIPEPMAIRVEEFVNAFDYAYSAPENEPFRVQAEVFPSPNRRGYHVLHLGIKAREIDNEERKPVNLVFVIDVSGSMSGSNRLGLVKRSLAMLVDQLDGRDSVAIVTYGSSARTQLPPTRVSSRGRDRLHGVIATLSVEGSTNAQAGLELGYQLAARHRQRNAVNRVVLCSDGVANVGLTSAEALLSRVAREAESGVTITTAGFGLGSYNDNLMEQLADRGNGNYAYIDSADEARRVFVDQLRGTLEVVAKDVKIQMTFDSNVVERYRLLGFENRMLARQDFDNDRVDAGEIGAGHTVTAIYEIRLRENARAANFGTLRVRHKAPNGTRSRLTERRLPMSIVRGSYDAASAPTQLSMVAAGLAEKLRDSYWARNLSYSDLLRMWNQIPDGLREREDVRELGNMIRTAQSLDNRSDRFAQYVPVDRMDFDRVPVIR
ncbi:MAG: von Willebrand factor type A domain-containing protein [Myxococcota bacterium]